MEISTIQPTPTSKQTIESSDKVVHYEVVIGGGGTAGITVAAQLTKGFFNTTEVVILDPSSNHFYQPAWTLVGAGTYRKEDTRREEASVIPSRANWIQDAVTAFDPENTIRIERELPQIFRFSCHHRSWRGVATPRRRRTAPREFENLC